jgi:NitT/TauT family transport system ATP-binding protein
MLRLTGVEMSYGAEKILAHIDLTLAPGEFVVVLGASGCGKTTLLRMAAGAIGPPAGAVENSFSRTASVYQEPRLLPWLDAVDNAAFGLKALGADKKMRRDQARKTLARLGFGAADFAKRPAAMSGGMAQRVAIARARAVAPDLLLMDEPFGALDIGLRRRLQDLTRREAENSGQAVLFVTHDVAEALRLASRIVVLSQRPSRIVADLANEPRSDPAQIFEAAAALLRRPEIEAALFSPPGELM